MRCLYAGSLTTFNMTFAEVLKKYVNNKNWISFYINKYLNLYLDYYYNILKELWVIY